MKFPIANRDNLPLTHLFSYPLHFKYRLEVLYALQPVKSASRGFCLYVGSAEERIEIPCNAIVAHQSNHLGRYCSQVLIVPFSVPPQ